VESYLRPHRLDRIAQVSEDDDETSVIATAAKTPLDDTLRQILRRIDRIKAELRTVQQSGVAKQQEGWVVRETRGQSGADQTLGQNLSLAGIAEEKGASPGVVRAQGKMSSSSSRETRNPRCQEPGM